MQCWHANPEERLTFEELVKQMEGLLENRGEYVSFPVNEDYYKIFPTKGTSKGPTPRVRKEDEYLMPVDMIDDAGIFLDCGIDKIRKKETISYSNNQYVEAAAIHR